MYFLLSYFQPPSFTHTTSAYFRCFYTCLNTLGISQSCSDWDWFTLISPTYSMFTSKSLSPRHFLCLLSNVSQLEDALKISLQKKGSLTWNPYKYTIWMTLRQLCALELFPVLISLRSTFYFLSDILLPFWHFVIMPWCYYRFLTNIYICWARKNDLILFIFCSKIACGDLLFHTMDCIALFLPSSVANRWKFALNFWKLYWNLL